MAKYSVESTTLKATADAIREKTGSSGLIEWKDETGFADAIEGISSGSGDGSDGGENIWVGFDFDEWLGSPTYRIDACMIDGDGNTVPVVYDECPVITVKNNSFFVIEATVWKQGSGLTPNPVQSPLTFVGVDEVDGQCVWIENGKALIFLSSHRTGESPTIEFG